jgi:hypothetical protein
VFAQFPAIAADALAVMPRALRRHLDADWQAAAICKHRTVIDMCSLPVRIGGIKGRAQSALYEPLAADDNAELTTSETVSGIQASA